MESEENGIEGDIDAWFVAFERGDFAAAWNVKQATVQADLDAWCREQTHTHTHTHTHTLSTVQDTTAVYDASLD